MSQPFVGEIRMFAGNFAPAGWMFCEGQLLPISEYETLFNLIGTTYGGDGQSTFALPDLRGRLPIHQGNGFTLGETGGVETVTLTPSRSRPTPTPTWRRPTKLQAPAPRTRCRRLLRHLLSRLRNGLRRWRTHPTSISSTGGSQPHDNFQPYLCVDFIISLFGVFPSPT